MSVAGRGPRQVCKESERSEQKTDKRAGAFWVVAKVMRALGGSRLSGGGTSSVSDDRSTAVITYGAPLKRQRHFGHFLRQLARCLVWLLCHILGPCKTWEAWKPSRFLFPSFLWVSEALRDSVAREDLAQKLKE